METIGPSAFVVAILYLLSRWALATVEHAVAHPGNGHPQITWRVTWWIAILVSGLSTASTHVWLLTGTMPDWRMFMFNGLVFGGFLVGFIASGHFDHKVRLGLRAGHHSARLSS
jgi:hypothetical protein